MKKLKVNLNIFLFLLLFLFSLSFVNAETCSIWDITSGTSHVFNHDGSENSLSQIDSTHYLNVYGEKYPIDNSGHAVVLTVNQTDWTITSGAKYEFDADYDSDNSLIQIDSTHYLNVYAGLDYDGYAVVLTVNETDWTITSGAKHDFDADYVRHQSLSQIDSTHYLNAYAGLDYDGYAIVLTVNQTDWTITSGAKHEFDTANGEDNSLIQIDSTHYLNAYQGSGNDGYAVVLTVDNSTWTITSGAKHEFDNISAVSNSLSQIDSTHYINAYSGGSGDAVILTVNKADWTITSGAKSEFGTDGSYNSLIQIDSSHYLNTFRPFPPFYARVLTVNKADWAITTGANYEVGWSYGFSSLSKIDSSHYLTTYQDAATYGRATVLIIELPGAFNSTWNTSKIGVSNSTSIKLPLESDGIYNFVADWGDGTNDTITLYNQSEVTHNYGVEGTYNVSITGEIVGFRFNNGSDKLKITDISNWGILRVGNNNGYFYGCSNLNSSATDSLDLTGTTDLSYMFRGASAFNGSISSWDVSSVIDMDSMFNCASAFNGNISNWDVSSVTNMSYIFIKATNFNQDLTNWNVTLITEEPTNFATNSALELVNYPIWNIPLIPSEPESFNMEVKVVTLITILLVFSVSLFLFEKIKGGKK